MRYKTTAETFLKDVEGHELSIFLENGVYRHLYCAEPGTINQSFNIVTTPGYLHYYGDMGAYSFSRVHDMFNFFRRDDISINEGYWAEKLQAVDRDAGYKEFDWDEFVSTVIDYVRLGDDDAQDQAREDYIREELRWVECDEYGAVEWLRRFDNDNEADADLTDFWEMRYEVPSNRYLWACYAIVWAIQQYDLLDEDTNE